MTKVSPWPDVETGNVICAVGLHSLSLADTPAPKFTDDDNYDDDDDNYDNYDDDDDIDHF